MSRKMFPVLMVALVAVVAIFLGGCSKAKDKGKSAAKAELFGIRLGEPGSQIPNRLSDKPVNIGSCLVYRINPEGPDLGFDEFTVGADLGDRVYGVHCQGKIKYTADPQDRLERLLRELEASFGRKMEQGEDGRYTTYTMDIEDADGSLKQVLIVKWWCAKDESFLSVTWVDVRNPAMEKGAQSLRVRFKKGGISIERLGHADPERTKLDAVNGWMMALPGEKGFSPNVNWLKQDPGKELSVAEFLDMSRKQYNQVGATIIKSGVVSDKDVELEVEIPRMRTHLFQRAIKDGQCYYVITGTALNKQWAHYSNRLIKCVRSARVD